MVTVSSKYNDQLIVVLRGKEGPFYPIGVNSIRRSQLSTAPGFENPVPRNST